MTVQKGKYSEKDRDLMRPKPSFLAITADNVFTLNQTLHIRTTKHDGGNITLWVRPEKLEKDGQTPSN